MGLCSLTDAVPDGEGCLPARQKPHLCHVYRLKTYALINSLGICLGWVNLFLGRHASLPCGILLIMYTVGCWQQITDSVLHNADGTVLTIQDDLYFIFWLSVCIYDVPTFCAIVFRLLCLVSLLQVCHMGLRSLTDAALDSEGCLPAWRKPYLMPWLPAEDLRSD